MSKLQVNKGAEPFDLYPIRANLFLGTGTSSVQTHFGEILQGQFPTENGIIRALVTLRCPEFHATAFFRPIKCYKGLIQINPRWCTKAKNAAQLTLNYIGQSQWGGIITLYSNIPEGIGAGSSTGNVVTAIRAAADSFGVSLSDAATAKIAVAAETASDSIMFDSAKTVLFAQRKGEVLETFGRLPAMKAIGVTDGNAVDTLAHPPAKYNDAQTSMFADLRGKLRSAIESQSAAGIAEVATASAVINQEFLPKPNFDLLLKAMSDSKALGISVSHSGSAIAFLFDATCEETQDRIANLNECLRSIGKRNPIYFEPHR